MAGKRSTVDLVVVAVTLVLLAAGVTQAAITIDTVHVGDTGNAADYTGYGAVAYSYNIGKYKVTAGQYTAFLNAVAATDTYALYNIPMSNTSYGSYAYSVDISLDKQKQPPYTSIHQKQYLIKLQYVIHWRLIMKWAGMYLIGYIVLIGGILAALWKMGVLASIGMTWTVIGVVILIGFGIMIAVSHSGKKENIEIDRK